METRLFLVEHYRPGSSPALLAAAAALVHAEAERRRIRHVRTIAVPGDESYLSLFEAPTSAEILAAYAAAGVPCERISEALPIAIDQKEESCADWH